MEARGGNMNQRAWLHFFVINLAGASFLMIGCQHEAQRTASSANTPASPTSRPQTAPRDVIVLPRQTLTVRTTRDDITVGALALSFYSDTLDSERKDPGIGSVWVNGTPLRRGRMYLKQVGEDHFEL